MRVVTSIGVASFIALLFVLDPLGSRDADPDHVDPPAPPIAPVASEAPAARAPDDITTRVAAADVPDPEPQVAAPTAQMSWCEAAGCTITFTFVAPMPKARVSFEPNQAGTQTWRTPTELVFTPANGALLAGHQIAVAIPEAGFNAQLTVPYFSAAGKLAEWPVTPGKPKFVAFLNGYVSHLGRGSLFALYDQPVEPAAIARRAKVTTAGKPLAVRVRRPTSTAQIYDAPIALPNLVTLDFDRLPPDGELVVVELPSLDDDGNVAPRTTELMINTTLAAASFSDGNSDEDRVKGKRTPLEATFRVPFTNQVTAKHFSNHVTITPKPRSVQTYVRGTEGTVAAHLEPGVLYRLTIDTGLHDVLGNRLGAPVTASFRAQDRPPALALPSGSLVLEQGRAKLPVRATNVGNAKLVAHRFATATEWLAARAAGSAECEGSETAIDLVTPLNDAAVRDVPLESGLYCVSVKGKGRGSEAKDVEVAATTFVQVSGVAVTAKVFDKTVFAWATRLVDGKPLAATQVALVDAAGKSLATGTTAADGTVKLADLAIAGPAGMQDTAFLVVGNAELVAPLADDTLSHARQFGLGGRVAGAEPLAASVFTERGVYRPGETVHVKSLVRDPATHRPATGELAIVINDPRGEQIATSSTRLDEFGGTALELALEDGAKVGEYTIHATQGDRTTVRSFRVEEYRVPTFAVTVGTDEPWLTGAPAHAAIVASYLHGGSLAGRDLKWEVSRTPEPFAPPAWKGFVFDATSAIAGAGPRVAESLTHGTDRLDGQGHFLVKLKPDHGPAAGPMRYAVEAAVTDVDRQVYTGKLTRVVHPADVYVGVGLPALRLFSAGDTVKVPIVAVAPDGTARAGIAVTATLERVDYHGVTRVTDEGTQRLNRPVTTVTRRCTVTTRDRAVDCSFAIQEAGEYVVRAAALDGKRRPVEAAFGLSASGGNSVAWPRFDHERIQVVADKASYRPGDVARLIIQSPFPHARGLLVLERDGVIEHRLFSIDGDTPELRVPITDAQVPNVYASVMLVRGRIHDDVDATGFPTGAPAFRMGYTELRVEPRTHRLDIEVKPDSAKAFPGSTLGVELVVRGADGKPHAGQATVMVVDEAVLGLTRFKTPDPLAEIFAARPLAVRTADSRLDLLTSRRSRREQVFPAGDGGEHSPEAAPLADLPADLRRLFKSTAFYNTDVRVGTDGRARISFALPDNVTTYRIMAIVVDKETRAGAGQGSVLARKPLIVQPALPRFVHPGDHLRLEARVFNGTEANGNIALTAAFQGITLEGAAVATADANAGGEAKFSFPVVVPEEAQGVATLRFAARLGAFTDAIEVKIPILDPGSSRKLVVSKLVTANDKLTLPLPADRRAGSVKVEITASTTPLSELKDSVQYLMQYPNGCIEQTTSTAYPLVVLKDLLPEMGVTVDEAELRKMSEAGVKRILSFQTSSGGLSYWPGSDQPHAFATAFGLTVLIEAKGQGYEVPDKALALMADYLETTLRQGTITGEMPHLGMADADSRAFFVMTLGRLGRPQAAYVSTLWDKRDQLTPFGLAFLGVAVSEGSGDPSLLQPILAAVRTASKEEPLEAYYERDAKGAWSFDSPLRTHASALLAFAGTTNGAMSGKLLTGLLARRTSGLWGNTQENVFGMMAIARLTTKATTDTPKLTVRVNGKTLDASKIHATTDRMKRIELTSAEVEGSDQLVVEIENGGKPVFATMRMTYTAKLDDKNRAARNSGFAIKRTYETVDGTSLEGKRVKLGSLVRVRLRVTAAAANNYVAIDDKLPAGLEPLNAALATTETVAAGKLTPELTRTLARLSYSELRDSRVAFYIDDMPAGSYEMVYVARATTPGKFIRPAAGVEAMYKTHIAGSSAIDDIVIE